MLEVLFLGSYINRGILNHIVKSGVWSPNEVCGHQMGRVVTKWGVWSPNGVCGHQIGCVVAKWGVWSPNRVCGHQMGRVVTKSGDYNNIYVTNVHIFVRNVPIKYINMKVFLKNRENLPIFILESTQFYNGC